MCSWERCEPKRKRRGLDFLSVFSLKKMLPFIANNRKWMRESEREAWDLPVYGSWSDSGDLWERFQWPGVKLSALRDPICCDWISQEAWTRLRSQQRPQAHRPHDGGCPWHRIQPGSCWQTQFCWLQTRAICSPQRWEDRNSRSTMRDSCFWRPWFEKAGCCWQMWKAGVNVLEATPATVARLGFWLLGILMFDPHSHIYFCRTVLTLALYRVPLSPPWDQKTNEVFSIMKLSEGFLQEQAVSWTSHLTDVHSQRLFTPKMGTNILVSAKKTHSSESWQCSGIRKLLFCLLTWCL